MEKDISEVRTGLEEGQFLQICADVILDCP